MTTINQLKNYCAKNKLRLTPPRLAAFKILHAHKQPITAYEVLEKMSAYIANPQPPTAYRALDFLIKNKLAHRVESINAYVLCRSGLMHGNTQFLICDECGHVTELPPCFCMYGKIAEDIQEAGFEHKSWFTEVHGKCSKCLEGENNTCLIMFLMINVLVF